MINNNKQRNRPSGNEGSRNFRSGGSKFKGSKSRDFGNKGFRRDSREMHKVTCAKCKKECEVPFKPTEGKPVYCRECFEKQKPQRF